ncbi:SUMO-activating enzyme subunit 2 [Cimex lectularius]|uniref:SUMO-activating enzyme subunit n=1 Tax=Cimex lectularius TaxID=79782 RepID=A0A8I6RMZ8_CIMLE|nr:SUMO-activating enzyme subunit 2 [Cimex lectularius]
MALTCLNEETRTKLKESPVLVVGAGGIGCELLKNLVMTGFENIEIIDLDTIEVSNLNRQFLFQKQHVGQSKAKVAKESVLRFNPASKIVAHHASVIGPEYNVNYFKRFKLVLNALDNLAARGHVNRMCLAAGVPLVESGTAGYSGQVEIIIKGLTKCYECEPKPQPKVYASCTIRNTPSEHIHCTIWAKYLFNQLFGEEDADVDVSPDTVTDPEISGDPNAAIKKPTTSTRNWAKQNGYEPEKIFSKLFTEDIKYLLTMDKLWEKRRKPEPLEWGNIPETSSSSPSSTSVIKDQRQWSLKECVEVFSDNLLKLKEISEKLDPGSYLIWDKDEEVHMNFVASCANLRAHVFHIPMKTKFDIKSMAGNIIPAIATSNAVIAGMVTHYALKILEGRFQDCPSVYLRQGVTARGMQIVPEKGLQPPNPKCRVCGDTPQLTLVTNLAKMTCKEFESSVLKRKLNMPAPDVCLYNKVIISSDPEETEQNNEKTLKEMGVADGAILDVDDFLQTYSLKLILTHREMKPGEPDFFIVGDMSELKKEIEKASQEYKKVTNGKDEDMEIVDDKESRSKRKSETISVPAKKRKTEDSPESDSDDVVPL